MLQTKRNSNTLSYEVNMKCKLAVIPSNRAKPVLSCEQEAALFLLPTFTLGSTMTFWLNLGMRKTNFLSPSSSSNFGNPGGMAVYLSSSVTTWTTKRERENKIYAKNYILILMLTKLGVTSTRVNLR